MNSRPPPAQSTADSVGESGVLVGHVFDGEDIIPAGNWKLSVVKGDAWVFFDRGNFVLHAGDGALLSEMEGPITIRRLYTKGYALYRAVPLRWKTEDGPVE